MDKNKAEEILARWAEESRRLKAAGATQDELDALSKSFGVELMVPAKIADAFMEMVDTRMKSVKTAEELVAALEYVSPMADAMMGLAVLGVKAKEEKENGQETR